MPEGSEYLGFIFATGEAPEDVEASLRAAHALLRIDIVHEAGEEASAAGRAGAERQRPLT